MTDPTTTPGDKELQLHVKYAKHTYRTNTLIADHDQYSQQAFTQSSFERLIMIVLWRGTGL
jgi:hypothetical protein